MKWRRVGERLSRRRLLRGMLGGSAVMVGLPWLEIFAGRAARAGCDSGFPRRFGQWMWGNGNLPDRWTPIGDGDDWELSEQLQPLAAFQRKMTVVSGMTVKVQNAVPHWSGASGLLTGGALEGDDDDWAVLGPTLDQVIAAEVGGDTIYRSLSIGVESEDVFSFTDATTRNYGETDPYTLYERLFGDTFREPGEEGTVDPSLGFRRSALDAVMTDIDELQSVLGYTDKVRLEQHLDGVRELESRLARLQEDPPDYEACLRPDAPEGSYPDIDGRPQLAAINDAMARLLAMALACDQTRVFAYQFSKPVSNPLYPDASDGHHNLTHNEPGEQPEVNAITLQIMEQLAVFLDVLDSVPEGDGTLLDNCLLLCTSEVSEGRTHSLDDIPMIVAGGGCGRIAMGKHVRSYTQDNAGKAILSLMRAMDLPAATWGEGDSEVDDGLSEIEV